MLSEKGKIASITAEQKHSARLAAVCTIRADGLNLPLMFIVRGVPGGKIEENEIATCPKGHVYTVQKKAWMDARVWHFYILEGSVLLVDNLNCHVSDESEMIVKKELHSILQALPKNSTSVCQSLDVGIMGPLKAKLKELWLAERPPPLKPGEKRKKKTAADKRLETIKRAITAWESLDPETVTKALNKALLTKV
ncbi:hypothetical protein Pcac1_g13481 [Phytophthora cactorum]|uniref:DDE-1 domain-containing protein n=3 Tax=Phytophthora cactorum TaxID=29920 RepID=A0A8T1B1X7_9STRA|nr:hypothetical protein Pcac1_g13481 [Phytophthora cactorum]KAG2797233.1 hypothetical protein PC111_g21380 [Phytophthora cactorum]KAG2803002.1 hypothetical protein PC112_g19378 [Phytophthora cactorum]KAG2840521.1 hypothetical protein PC113_g19242 [Phytophthora cactorum]KAG2882918.1 hypothetical protein PC114_g20802 [Phytophthora cactorum]